MNGELFEKGPAAEAKATYYAEVIEKNRYWKYYGYVYSVVDGNEQVVATVESDVLSSCKHQTKQKLRQFKRQGQANKKWTYR